MIKDFLSIFSPHYPSTLVYMLQSTEYDPKEYLKWIWRTKNFNNVIHRKALDLTKSAKMLLWALKLGILLQIISGLILIYLGYWQDLLGGVAFGVAIILAYPFLWAHLLTVPVVLGRILIIEPSQKKLITESEKIFANHKAVKIAVAGSYGKTTMKELLNTVLSEGLKVSATPANKNVSSSHAVFAKNLTGDEEVLIIEYGEGEPGDVEKFTKITHPTHAVISGIAPAHLDRYKTLKAAGLDIFSVTHDLDSNKVFVNGDSDETKPFTKKEFQVFNNKGALGWKTSNITSDLEGTKFTISKGKKSLKLSSKLVGRHQVGFLAFVAALALQLGLTDKQVISGIAKTSPFEHRMQPYHLGGAWVVDDTYNGNLEGIRAGTHLLSDIEANRKIFVTPGLVDQGEETERVHVEVGKLIAEAKPDLVVLMKNSVTEFIKLGLKKGKFKGDLNIEDKPLEFYQNLNHFVASGDLVVMQNDWTDNYH